MPSFLLLKLWYAGGNKHLPVFNLKQNAMANLITRLIMDVTQYDGGLQKAQKSLDKFIDKNVSLNGVMTNAIGTISKIAGVLGVAMGAQEAFTRVIRGSQTTSDEYDKVMRSVTTTVDAFFTSISTGDFSVFNQGLSTMIAKAREANDALDALGNATISYNYFTAKNQADFSEAIATLRDKTAKKDDIKAAQGTVESILGSQREISKQFRLKSEKAVKNLIVEANSLKAGDVSVLDLDKALILDISESGESRKEELAKQYQEYLKEYDKIVKESTKTVIMPSTVGAITKQVPDLEKIEEKMASVNNKYKEAIVYDTVLVKKSDDWLKSTSGIVIAADNADRAFASMEKTYNRVKKGGAGSGMGAKKEIAPIFNYEQLNEEIKTAISGKDALSQTVLDAISTGKTLPVLTQPIQATMINSEDEKVEGEDSYESLRSKMDMYTLAQNKIQEYTSMLAIANEEEKKYLNEQITIWKQYANELDGVLEKKEQLDTMTQGLEGIGTALGKIGNLSDSTFGAMLNYLGGVTSAVAAAIPAIEAMTAAKNQEANANTKAAASGAASSVASIPFVGAIMAVAAVASVIAAIMSIPSFAEGGVIGGNNYMDGITARVSSGEMIMNEADQKKLYNAIHSGNLGGGGSKTVVTGEQIVTVINNYGKRTGKGVILKG